MTADGARAVDDLTVGERIVTRSGLRRLRGVRATHLARATLVDVAQDTLGIGRPREAILVAPEQPVLIRDWRARLIYGTAQALIPAGRLVDGTLIRLRSLRDADLFTLHFDDAEVIYAGGLELGCSPATVAA